ncbi:sugar phosphate isomerase/epimerase family protein [Pleomorphovibrio marinus]|uniref:sugar phosphate isomerase/epimerase family protein n=1 Tax=Pleomorphovibrio marinus TaxID=2164132 RepID=UPI000E0C0CBA|nr:sugar phosphate isomerase/epimerase [Pleomorphovibrio marinus]
MQAKNHRREFLKKAGLLTISGLAFSHMLQADTVNKPIGLQLYSLREDIPGNTESILEKVAEIGYKNLEAANYDNGKIYGMTPQEMRKKVTSLGMRMSSAHVGGPGDYSKESHQKAIDWWKKAAKDHAEAGATHIIKPSMPIPSTLDELKIWCDYYNAVGKVTKEEGLMFGFHNHSREFEEVEGKVMYDVMLQNTDSDLFCMELDVYWCQQAGKDPVKYLQEYKGRFPLLHIKDEKEIGASGKMNFEPIFKAAYAQGMEDFFVEVEKYNYSPLESVQRSHEYLANASYVK